MTDGTEVHVTCSAGLALIRGTATVRDGCCAAPTPPCTRTSVLGRRSAARRPRLHGVPVERVRVPASAPRGPTRAVPVAVAARALPQGRTSRPRAPDFVNTLDKVRYAGCVYTDPVSEAHARRHAREGDPPAHEALQRAARPAHRLRAGTPQSGGCRPRHGVDTDDRLGRGRRVCSTRAWPGRWVSGPPPAARRPSCSRCQPMPGHVGVDVDIDRTA